MPKPTPPLPTADQAVVVTALCESGRCGICPGKIISATPAHGQACSCSCHRERRAA